MGVNIQYSHCDGKLHAGFKVGQPWITNLWVMWTDGWVMSNCTQDSQKVFTKLLSVPDNAKKTSIFSPKAKIKICTLSKAPPPVWPHHQHTHKSSENFTYGFVQSSIPIYRPKHTFDLKNSHFVCAGFQDKFNTLPLKPNETEPSFRKLNSLPTKLYVLFPQARELCPPTYSLCWGISSKFRPATWKYHIPHQRDMPPCWFRLPPWESAEQANEFQSRHYGHLALIIHEHNRPNSQFKVVLP